MKEEEIPKAADTVPRVNDLIFFNILNNIVYEFRIIFQFNEYTFCIWIK